MRGLGLALATLLVGCGRVEGTLQLPAQASTVAGGVDRLYYFVFWVCVIYLVVASALLVSYMVRFRRRPGTAPADGANNNLVLGVVWSAPPALLVVLMFFSGFRDHANLETPPADSYRIQCVASVPDANAPTPFGKAGFEFVYPNGAKSAELNVPPNEPVEIVLQSSDVSHAFFVAGFRVKQDIIPGRVSEVWFEAVRKRAKGAEKDTSVKEHLAVCAGHCGTQHNSKVVVHPDRAAFETWLRNFDGPRTGEAVYEQDCKACHSLDEVITLGPSFKGLFGSTRKVLNTKTGEVEDVTADKDYLEESIRDPGIRLSRMGKDFSDQMDKGLWNKLRPKEVKNILAFIREQK
jgi:cytochrome c oxidase subunit 2